MSIFKGCGTAMITPFRDDKLDFCAFSRQIEFQISNHADALVICGTTGEASTMNFDEKLSAFRFAVEKSKKRIPIIAGTGGNNTREVIALSKAAALEGVDALLIVTPYYNKTTQNGLIAHYTAIAESVSLPIIVYNVPSRTGVNVLPATMYELSKNKNITAIKEASGNIEQIVTLASKLTNCDIYSGNDDHVLPVLSLGGIGVISTVSNIIPSDMHNLCEAFFAGDLKKAQDFQFKLLPICKAAFCEVNPIPIKTMMNILNMDAGELRLPLVPPSDENKRIMQKAILDYHLEVNI
ncbi:MAG: 4-hydroxy-tetrahydrodipicolinate synthase [Clostridia bacterium]